MSLPQNRPLPGSESSSGQTIPRRPVAGSQRDAAREIERHTVPPPEQRSSLEQEGRPRPEEQHTKTRRGDLVQEPVGNSEGRVTGQNQAVGLVSDDNASTSTSSSDPFQAYEQHPQAIDIDRDGFHARATPGRKLEFPVFLG